MAIVDKCKQRFDENLKADKLGLIAALIHASYNLEKYKVNVEGSKVLNENEKFILRLIPTLEMYQTKGRGIAFGENIEEVCSKIVNGLGEDIQKDVKRLGSLQTAGGEMGIWVNSARELSPLAEKVAKEIITTKQYISVVFLNLFSFFEIEGELTYKHFLKETLHYFKDNGVENTYNKSILIDIFCFEEEDNDTKLYNQRNILFDYLTSTFFFIKQSANTFKLSEDYQPYINELIEICNEKYKNSDFEEVKSTLNRDSNTTKKEYALYLMSNEDKLIQLQARINLDTEISEQKNTDQLPNNSEIRGVNKIYYGAPGTGKSYGIAQFIKNNGIPNYSDKIDNLNVFRTTLHPEYTYSDFVGQVMPIVKDESITYEFVPKIFTKAIKRAFAKEVHNQQPVFLVLEELSRANVAAVFGDLFQLLDRDDVGESEYRINNTLIANEVFGDANRHIYIPANLYILGTVNTSDQNVFVMDTAFKRRFEFDYVPTKITKEMIDRNNCTFTVNSVNGPLRFTWVELITTLNQYIVTPTETGGLGLSEDKQLGQFFIKFKNPLDEEYNFNQITGKLIQYLWQDIEKISYSENKIFDKNILHFGELYDKAIQRENVFSDEFLVKLKANITK